MSNYTEKLIELLRSRSTYTIGELASRTGTNKEFVRAILNYGKDTIFIIDSDKWILNPNTPNRDISKFIDLAKNREGRLLDESRKERARKKTKGKLASLKNWGKGPSPRIIHGNGNDTSPPDRTIWSDSLTRGKVKTYQGPQNTYWMDDDYARKNVPLGTINSGYDKEIKPGIKRKIGSKFGAVGKKMKIINSLSKVKPASSSKHSKIATRKPFTDKKPRKPGKKKT